MRERDRRRREEVLLVRGRSPATSPPTAMKSRSATPGRLFFACSTTGQRSASKTMAFAPQWLARYTSSAAVDRHETLTAAAPMRPAPPCTSRNSGRFCIMMTTLVLRLKPRRCSAARRAVHPVVELAEGEAPVAPEDGRLVGRVGRVERKTCDGLRAPARERRRRPRGCPARVTRRAGRSGCATRAPVRDALRAARRASRGAPSALSAASVVMGGKAHAIA